MSVDDDDDASASGGNAADASYSYAPFAEANKAPFPDSHGKYSPAYANANRKMWNANSTD